MSGQGGSYALPLTANTKANKMDLNTATKAQLRNAMRAQGMSYANLDNAGMVQALQAAVALTLASVKVQLAQADAAYNDPTLTAQNDAPAPDYRALGQFGLGTDAATAECPHCGINHNVNGCITPDDEAMRQLPGAGLATSTGKTLYELGVMHNEYECLNCHGQWGARRDPYVAPVAVAPVSTGLTIEKNRPERNGYKRPSAGGVCRAIWNYCTELQATQATPVTIKQAKANSTLQGWDLVTTTVQFYQWRKWSAPTASEMAVSLLTAVAANPVAAPEASATVLQA